MNIALIQPATKSDWKDLPELVELQEEWIRLQQTIRKQISSKYSISISQEEGMYTPSTGLLILASIARSAWHNVHYYEEAYCRQKGIWEAELEEIARWADVVGLTAMTISVNNAYGIITELRSYGSSAIMIMGGPHVSFRVEEALDHNVDIVVRGEAEIAWEKLVTERDEKGRFFSSKVLEKIPGVVTKQNIKRRGNLFSPQPQVDNIPLPAFDLLPEELRQDSELYVFASRGCINHCKFCLNPNLFGGWRVKSIPHVIELIRHMVKWRPNLITLYFPDSQFPTRPSFLRDLKNALDKEESRPLHFRCMVRADTITPESAGLLAEIGFVEILIGIESADNTILSLSRKNSDTRELRRGLEILSEKIPYVNSSWMVGLPGMDRKHLENSIAFMRSLFRDKLLAEASFRMFIPYPGSWFYENAGEVGLQIMTNNWDDYGRRHFPPPYKIKEMSPEEIYQSYLEALTICNSEMAGFAECIVN